tara:strand:+ start:6781 stop:8181 length:1401 start_codon:yes stop_codon:yes gene_type:complete
MKKISPLQLYKHLPGTNCRECQESSCMAFASTLIERSHNIEDCTPLMKEDKYSEKRGTLFEILTPPIKEIKIGNGDRQVVIGGEEVMYRHDLTYFNPTAIFIDINDGMENGAIQEKVEKIKEFTVTRIGEKLNLDGIAIRSTTNDPTKFGEIVLSVVEKYDLPLILCSYNSEILEVGLAISADKKPLIYAANKENWESIVNLALKYDCPVVASAPGNPQELVELVQNLTNNGVENIVLDIGTYPRGKKFYEMNENLAMMRRLAIEDGIKNLGFPILGVPMVAWMQEKDEIKASKLEATLASTQLLRYCDVLILHSLETWALLPLLTLRQNIYTDPRVPISVDAGIREIEKPNKNSPVLVTSNFALTYYTVASDLESAKIPCYVLVVDTDGLAVEVAIAGGKLTASGINEIFEESNISDRIDHKKLIIPGRIARLSGEIEDATGLEILVGPIDSARIGGFLEKNWSN